MKDNTIDILRKLDLLSNEISELKNSTKQWLSVVELSQYLGLKKSTVYQYVYRKQIPYKKIPGSRKLIFSKNEIDSWIESYSVDNEKKEAIETSDEIWTGILDKNG